MSRLIQIIIVNLILLSSRTYSSTADKVNTLCRVRSELSKFYANPSDIVNNAKLLDNYNHLSQMFNIPQISLLSEVSDKLVDKLEIAILKEWAEDNALIMPKIWDRAKRFPRKVSEMLIFLLETGEQNITKLRSKLGLLSDFEKWQEIQREKWASRDVLWEGKLLDLVDYIYDTLALLDKNKGDVALQTNVLYAYNFLREELWLGQADNFADIDLAWLNSEQYHIFKSFISSAINQRFSFDFYKILLSKIGYLFNAIKNGSPGDFYKRLLLNNYNALREQKGLSLIAAPDEVSLEWLKELEELYWFKELSLPDQKMLTEALSVIGLTRDNFFIAYDPVQPHDRYVTSSLLNFSGKQDHYVILENKQDSALKLFFLYHELGHLLENSNYTHVEKLEYSEIAKQPEAYVELAKLSFDKSTRTGAFINKVLGWCNFFWVSPYAETFKKEMVDRLDKERSADLFAIELLYRQGKIDIILHTIYYFIFRHRLEPNINYDAGIHPIIIDHSKYPFKYLDHPSDFERGLYMAGFLISKNININIAFKKWETQGKCMNDKKAFG